MHGWHQNAVTFLSEKVHFVYVELAHTGCQKLLKQLFLEHVGSADGETSLALFSTLSLRRDPIKVPQRNISNPKNKVAGLPLNAFCSLHQKGRRRNNDASPWNAHKLRFVDIWKMTFMFPSGQSLIVFHHSCKVESININFWIITTNYLFIQSKLIWGQHLCVLFRIFLKIT